MKLPDFYFEQFPDFATLRDTLFALADAAPDLMRIDVIGHSREGRELFLATLGDFASGAPDKRPAIYVQSDIHALELGRTHILYAIRTLLMLHEESGLLHRRTFYFFPSINPDNAEKVIRYGMPFLRSRMPEHSDRPNTLCPADVDGDGKIGWMRRKRADGKFAIDPEDPRLMIPRTPDMAGPFYEMIPEGFIQNWSGDDDFAVVIDRNWNRAFPSAWQPDPGTGAYPLSEPELRAVADFMASRPNLCGALSLHVGGDCVVAPPNRANVSKRDSALLERIGNEGCQAMHVPYILSCELQVPPYVWDWPSADRPGTFVDYCYEQFGIPAFDLELSGLYASLGVTLKDIAALRDYDEFNALQRRTMAFYDQQKDVPPLYEPWHPFKHPQLGDVELGGLYHHVLYTRLISELPQEGARMADFLARFSMFTPQAALENLQIAALPEKGLYDIRVQAVNAGSRPTQLMERGNALWWTLCPRIEFQPASGVKILSPFRAKSLGHLNAFSAAPIVSWTLQVPDGLSELGTIVFDCGTGGTVTQRVRLS